MGFATKFGAAETAAPAVGSGGGSSGGAAGDKPPLKLRADLKIIRQVKHGEVGYVVKDPHSLEYFRFGPLQFEISQLCDGRRDAASIAKELNSKLPEDDALAPEDVADFLESLDKIGLLEKTGAARNAQLAERLKQERKARLLTAKGSMLYKRVPIVDPDRYLEAGLPYLRFFFTKTFVVLSLVLMALASAIVLAKWEEVTAGIGALFALSERTPHALLVLYLTVFVIIAIHEHAHAFTCKHFGGEVHELGFLFLFFQPCMYANVSDAWTFPDRAPRIWVVLAGGWIEFVIGSIAVFIWALTDPASTLNALCYQTLCVCGLSSVLFNFNPLIKLDGYYLLCDFLDMANLKDKGLACLGDHIKHWVFRMPMEKTWSRRERRVFLIYGAASLFWMSSMLLGLFLMAGGILVGAWNELGLVVFALAGYKFFGSFFWMFVGFLKNLRETHAAMFKTWYGKLSTATAGAGLVVLLLLPAAHEVQGACTLEALDRATVRGRTAGTIARVLVKQGDRVPVGQVLARLENAELALRLDGLRLDRENAALELARLALETGGDRVTALRTRIADLEGRIAGLERDLEELTIRAPIVGVVITPGLPEREGEYLGAGRDLCEIMEPSTIRVSIPVGEREVAKVREGQPVELRLLAWPELELRATVSRIVTSSEGDLGGVEKTFRVLIDVENPGGRFKPGMTGTASIRVGERQVYVGLLDWLGKTLNADLLMF